MQPPAAMRDWRFLEKGKAMEQPTPGRQALIVWLKFAGLLVLLALFGALIFWIRRSGITH